MNDLSRSVIDLAISTIKKTHHGVTIASVPANLQPDKEVSITYILISGQKKLEQHFFFENKKK